ncbi:secreted protein-related [Anaeramoeba flamelloides]|uniref:Secreted protein-related n=1 Tax=Anaeramoeba flamelloides TaxID=1746091 RepID=A0ABQ8Z9G8_9EUKA|nr:secreted protein-related [Anaeramoeba flamelloides]
MKSFKFVLLFVLFLLLNTTVCYYIDCDNGDDDNGDGSLENPFQTLDYVRDKIELAESDQILILAGCTTHLTKRWYIGVGGTESDPLTISTYGDIEKNGKATITGGSVTILASGASHFVISNLIIKDTEATALSANNANHVLVENVEVYRGHKNCMVFTQGSYVTVRNCVASVCPNNGIYFGGSETDRISHVIVEYCLAENVTANDGIVVHEDGSGNPAGSDFIIRHNHAQFCGEQGYDITTGVDIILYNNTSYHNTQGGITLGHSADNVTVLRHFSRDEPTQDTAGAIIVSIPTARVAYSIFVGNSYHMSTIPTDSNVENIVFENNLFLPYGSLRGATFDVGAGNFNLGVYNNIFGSLDDQPQNRHIRLMNTEISKFDFNNNIYWNNNPEDTRQFLIKPDLYDFVEWQDYFDSDSNYTNPEFVDLLNEDFYLKPNSPAIDKGLERGLKEDYSGSKVPCSSSSFPDIGAYEYCDVSDSDNDNDNDVDSANSLEWNLLILFFLIYFFI